MTEQMATAIGTIAATCTTVAFIPQVVQVVRTRSTHDISLAMYLIFTVGVVGWLTYGWWLNSLPMIIANSITLFLALTVLYYKIKYK